MAEQTISTMKVPATTKTMSRRNVRNPCQFACDWQSVWFHRNAFGSILCWIAENHSIYSCDRFELSFQTKKAHCLMTAYSVRCSLSAIFARQLITHLNSHTDDSGGKIGAFKFIKNRSIVYNCHKTLQVAMPSCIQALLMLTISIVGGQRNDGIPTRRSSHQSNQPMLHQRKSFEERKKNRFEIWNGAEMRAMHSHWINPMRMRKT